MSFVAVGTTAQSSSTTSPGLPAGIASGDILLLHIEAEGDGAGADAAPTGGDWTLVGWAGETSGANASTKVTVYYHEYDGTSPATTVPDTGNHTHSVISAWRGVIATGLQVDTWNNATASTSHSPALTTTSITSGRDVVLTFTVGDNEAITHTAAGNLDSTITSRAAFGSNTGSDGYMLMGEASISSTTTIGTLTATVTASERMAVVGVAFAPNTDPTITDAETDEDFRDGDTAVTLTGTNYEATQGTGKVELTQGATYTGAIAQTVTSWADTAIDITAVLSTLNPGTCYLWVTNDTGDRNTTGFQVTVRRKVEIELFDSANVTNGAATTAKLTAPSGAPTFSSGYQMDTSATTTAKDHATDVYTENSVWMEFTADAPDDQQYEFLVWWDGAVHDTETVAPKITKGSGTLPITASGASTTTGDAALIVVHALDAAGASTSSGSVAVGTIRPVTASGASTTTGSAAIEIAAIAHPITGSGASTTTGSASIVAARPVTAAGASTTAGSASIVAERPITAAGASTSSGTADVSATFTLDAAGASTTAGSVALGITHPVAASGASTTSGSAAIEIAAVTLPITASGASVTSGSADINAERPITAAGASVTTGGADPTATWVLESDGASTTTGTASIDLAGTLTMSASGASTTTGGADLTAAWVAESDGASVTSGSAAIEIAAITHPITASGASVTSGSVAISTARPVTATGASVTAGTADIVAERPVTAAGASTSSGSASIDLAGALSLTATGASTTSGTADLTATFTLDSDGTSASTGAADVTATWIISADGASTTAGSAAIGIGAITHPITATGASTTTGTAELGIGHPLAGTGASTTFGDAEIIAARQLSSSGASTTLGTAAIDVIIGLSAVGASTTLGTASILLSSPDDLIIVGARFVTRADDLRTVTRVDGVRRVDRWDADRTVHTI